MLRALNVVQSTCTGSQSLLLVIILDVVIHIKVKNYIPGPKDEEKIHYNNSDTCILSTSSSEISSNIRRVARCDLLKWKRRMTA